MLRRIGFHTRRSGPPLENTGKILQAGEPEMHRQEGQGRRHRQGPEQTAQLKRAFVAGSGSLTSSPGQMGIKKPECSRPRGRGELAADASLERCRRSPRCEGGIAFHFRTALSQLWSFPCATGSLPPPRVTQGKELPGKNNSGQFPAALKCLHCLFFNLINKICFQQESTRLCFIYSLSNHARFLISSSSVASPSCRPQPSAPRPPQAGQNIHVHFRADPTWKKKKGIWEKEKKKKNSQLCISAGLHEQRKSGHGELGSQNFPLLLVVKLLSGRKACPQNPTECLWFLGSAHLHRPCGAKAAVGVNWSKTPACGNPSLVVLWVGQVQGAQPALPRMFFVGFLWDRSGPAAQNMGLSTRVPSFSYGTNPVLVSVALLPAGCRSSRMCARDLLRTGRERSGLQERTAFTPESWGVFFPQIPRTSRR